MKLEKTKKEILEALMKLLIDENIISNLSINNLFELTKTTKAITQMAVNSLVNDGLIKMDKNRRYSLTEKAKNTTEYISMKMLVKNQIKMF